MSTAVAPFRNIDLATMSLDECPDLWTAVEAGLMHGLTPEAALDAAFGKWATENAPALQKFGISNFYDGRYAARAFVNYSLLTRFLAITCAEQDKAIKALSAQVKRLTAVLPYLPPTTE